MKYDIFISYRRDGGEYTARILRDQLTNTLPENGKLKQGCRASFTNLI